MTRLLRGMNPQLPWRRRAEPLTFQFKTVPEVIHDQQVAVLDRAKHLFELIVGGHEIWVEVLDTVLAEPNLNALGAEVQLLEEGNSSLLTYLNASLKDLLLGELDTPSPKGLVTCKANLLRSIISGIKCLRILKEDGNAHAAMLEYAESTFFLGACIGAGGILFADDPVSPFVRQARISQAPVVLDSSRAATLNDIRHAENRALKKTATEYFDAQPTEFRENLTTAAEAIAGKIVPVKFKTVYGWLSKHKRTVK